MSKESRIPELAKSLEQEHKGITYPVLNEATTATCQKNRDERLMYRGLPIHSCLSCFSFGLAFGSGYAFGKPKAAPNAGLHFSTQCCCWGAVTFPTADGALM